MLTNADQLAQIQKSAIETMQAAAAASFAGFEKIAALNVQATKTSLEESTDVMRSLMEVKEPKQWTEMASGSLQPASDKFATYCKHVYEIANETGNDLARLFEQQYAEGNRQIHGAIDAFARNLPAGSEGLVTLMKQAVTAANNTFDQVNKATRQAVEVAEANMAAAAKTTTSAATAARAASAPSRKSA